MRVPVPVSSDGLEVVLNALDGAIFALNNSSVELIESPRRLSELNESGFLMRSTRLPPGCNPTRASVCGLFGIADRKQSGQFGLVRCRLSASFGWLSTSA